MLGPKTISLHSSKFSRWPSVILIDSSEVSFFSFRFFPCILFYPKCLLSPRPIGMWSFCPLPRTSREGGHRTSGTNLSSNLLPVDLDWFLRVLWPLPSRLPCLDWTYFSFSYCWVSKDSVLRYGRFWIFHVTLRLLGSPVFCLVHEVIESVVILYGVRSPKSLDVTGLKS